ncbi:aprataxin and PNK-like factor [Macrobrachium nipponense]|uniref:aprataxin and PNK-like factor n=1 Tax=Macrobrachium nipponense TaxID=159736 RepID=UPI0030C88616
MSISLIRVEAPDEKWEDERNEPEITPALPAVLGRGSLLRCGEKKISRRHAYLDWDDDGVTLTSVHQNPTYALVKGVLKELTEGDALFLSHGDKFGLLKDKYWYMISLPDSCKEEKTTAEDRKQKVSDNEIQDISKRDDSDSKLPDKDQENRSNAVENISSIKDSANNIRTKDTSVKICDGETTSNLRASKDQINKNEDIADDTSSYSGKDLLSAKVNVNKIDDSMKIQETVSAKELQEAVSSKRRDLPAWLKSTEVVKKLPPGKENEVHTTSHGGRRKTQASSTKRKASNNPRNSRDASVAVPKTDANNPNGCDVGKGEEGVISGNGKHPKQQVLQKDNHKHSSNNRKVDASPRKRTPTKKKGSPLKNNTKGLHVISDEDSEYDSGNEPDEPQAKTSKEAKTTVQHHSVTKHDMSDEGEESATGSEENKATPNKNKQITPTTNAARGLPSRVLKKKPRQPCQYGDKCYRKNQKHLADFSHVGDSDYHEDSSDPEASDDDRPQCEYGVDCYRKNPQHRKDYRHSRIPQPQRRAKRKARQQKQNDNDDSDDYDYDDPFLNDESSDDYAPTDSESFMEDDDDTQSTLEEGKKFVKKRK